MIRDHRRPERDHEEPPEDELPERDPPKPTPKPQPVEPKPEPVPQEPLYRQTTRTLDNAVAFTFPPDLHGYIFGDVAPTTGQAGQLVHWQIEWKGQFHSYFQEVSRRHRFLYLPDAFKLARRVESPHFPCIGVRFVVPTNGTIENTDATISFAATPFVDADRLAAATAQLAAKIDEPLPPGVTGPTFEPVLAGADRLHFRLALPGGTGLFQPREGAQVNLKLGLVDSVTVPAIDFKAVFDAMMGSGGAVLMRGEIEVDLGGGDVPNERVPFMPRLDDLNGPVFDYTEQPDPASGGVRCTLINAIESPVRITRLEAHLAHGDTSTRAEIRDLTLPVDRLGRGESISMLLAPTQPIEASPATRAVFDFEGVTVLPDREAIWDAVLDSTTVMHQPITVKAVPGAFDPPAAGGAPVIEIDVELKVGAIPGPTVTLSQAQPEGTRTLPLPIADLVLGRPNAGEYQYRVTTVRAGTVHEGDWKTETRPLLRVLPGANP